MGLAKDITCKVREKISVLLDYTRLTFSQIAAACMVSKRTISRIALKKRLGLKLETHRTSNCGRKRCTIRRDDRTIKNLAENNSKVHYKTFIIW